MPSRIPVPLKLGRAPFRVADAAAAGLGRGRLRGPDLARPFTGVRVVASPPSPPSRSLPLPLPPPPPPDSDADLQRLFLEHCAAFSPLLRRGQFFSHTTAARLWGCPLPRPFASDEPLHVTDPRRAIRRRGIHGHRANGQSQVARHGHPVSGPAETWLAMAALLSLDDLVAIGDHLVLDPWQLDPHDLRPYVTLAALTIGTANFSGRGAQAAASALPLLRQGAESRPETLLRLLLARALVIEPELQTEIVGADGTWIGRADLYFRDLKVIVEYDGELHRTSSRQYNRDEARIESFIEAGNAVVRVRKGPLGKNPASVVDRVVRALDRQQRLQGIEVPLSYLR